MERNNAWQTYLQKAIYSLEQQTGSVNFTDLRAAVEVLCGNIFDNDLFEDLIALQRSLKMTM